MQEHYSFLSDIVEKAILISKECVSLVDANQFEKLNDLILKREKVLSVLHTIHERLDLAQRSTTDPLEREKGILYNNQLNLLLEKIADYDEYIVLKLDEEKNKTQIEIAKAFKNKENLKGYNLNCLK